MPRKRGHRGSGSITRRTIGSGDRKRVVYQARWSRTEGGVRTRGSETFAFRSDAEWWLRQAGRGELSDRELTVAEYLDQWLSRQRQLRDSTLAQYANHVRVHLNPRIGHHPLLTLHRSHVEAMVDDLRKHVSPSTHRPLSPSTVRAIIVTLRSALEDGVPREIPDNVAKRVSGPRVVRPQVQAMTIEEAKAVLAAFRGTWLEQLVRFLLGSGVRIGEALALNQVDVQDGYVRLRRSKTALRTVAVTDDGIAALRELIIAAPRRGPDEPVFFSPRARDRLDRNSVNHAFTRILAENGLRHLSPHSMRHGTATLMLTLGVSMQTIADQLGHRNPGLTMRTYAHVDPSLRQRAVDILDEVVKAER